MIDRDFFLPHESLPEKTGCFNSGTSLTQASKEKKNDNECIFETSKKLLKIDFPYIMLPCEIQLSPGLLGLEESSLCSSGNSIMRLPCLWWTVWYCPWGSATDGFTRQAVHFFQDVVWEWFHFRLVRKKNALSGSISQLFFFFFLCLFFWKKDQTTLYIGAAWSSSSKYVI